ncbi:ATP-binding protein [Pedobacter sp. PAMC26386]|nr:ATP-binding protein [Pedobacter sp. PAMC26386]
MKKTLLLLVFVFGIFACNKKHDTKIFSKDINYDIAESFVDKNNDSAFYYFNKVVINSKDSLKVAMAYNYMSALQSDAGDYFGGQESLMISLNFLDGEKGKDLSCLSSNYNELGLTSVILKKYDIAIDYYDKSINYYDKAMNYYNKVFKRPNNNDIKLQILNNKALAYQKEKRYIQALKIFNEVIPKINKDQKQYARVLSNIAKTKWLQNPNYNAAPDLLRALSIREKENDVWGQNASFAHLADYYAQTQPDSALIYAGKMYLVAKKIKNPDDQIEALKKLIGLSPPKETKQYFITYRKLDDSLQTARNAAKNQFAVVRYEAEKNKADNLKLQKDNTEKKYQIIKQRVLLVFTFLLILTGSVASILWYRRRKQKLQLEAKNTIRENQLKTSKKVHDVVANGLYRVMAEIENQDSLDRDRILDKLEDMYEKSRDISYEELQFTDQNFQEKISDLLKSFATETTKVLVYMGNTVDSWRKVNVEAKYEIEHVLQELMVNMKKHSKANNVAVRFEQKNNCINIYYADNGVGIAEETQFKNGLNNTGNRIKNIHGEIIFDTKAEKGLKIKISFPIS